MSAVLERHPGISADTLAGLTSTERRVLLRVARAALAVATGLMPPASLKATLEGARRGRLERMKAAVFVTLFERGELRGCMGALEPLRPLPKAVADACLLAALEDPRFWPVRPDELPEVHLEISVLGPMVETSAPERLRLGIDGVVVEGDGRRALLLPQVATEQDWDARQMWRAVCFKAGLVEDAWRMPGTRLSIFQAVRFGGPATMSDRGTAHEHDPIQARGSLDRE